MYGRHRINANSDWERNVSKAQLFVFTPQVIAPVTVRPTRFSVTAKFVDTVSKELERNDTFLGNYGRTLPLEEFNSESNYVITPSRHGHTVNYREYQDFATFMLVWDNPPIYGRRVNTPSNTRFIYIGYFLTDQPVIQRYGRKMLQEDARLIFTHVNQVDITGNHSAFGSNYRTFSRQSVDIVDPTAVVQLNRDRQYRLDPDILLQTEYTSGDGSVVTSVPAESHVLTTNSPLQFNNNLYKPKAQLRSIFSGIRKKITQDRAAAGATAGFSSMYRSGYAGERHAVAHQMSTQAPKLKIGFEVNQIYTIEELLGECPSLKNRDNVEVLNLPFDLGCDALQTDTPTVTNIWTALIESTLPIWFEDAGITDIALRYSTYPEGRPARILSQDASWEILEDSYGQAQLGFTTNLQDSTTQRAIVETCISSLERDVFEIILENAGDFDLTIYYNCYNRTMVQLQFRDEDPLPAGAYTVSHGTYRSIATPLIGDEEDEDYNRSALGELVDGVLNNVEKIDVVLDY